MRMLIHDRDLKTLAVGVAVAAVSGLLMGAALYPDLDAEGLKAPQLETPGGGHRSEIVDATAGVAAYAGRVPDYVIGTDALKPPQYETVAAAEGPPPETAEAGEASDVMAYAAPQIQPARWQEEPREPSRYPSERGNVVYAIDLPAPPPPPGLGEEDALDYPPQG